MKRAFTILILVSVSCLQYGQTIDISRKTDEACMALIKEADMLFSNGQYDQCITILEGVMSDCSLSRNEKLHSLETLAKAYVETDDPGKAETTVNMMLVNFPHYELKVQDNPELYNRLVRKYQIHPELSVGIRNTADWIKYNTTKVYSVLDDVDYSVSYNQQLEGIFEGFGLMYYGWAEYQFDHDISINADLIFMWTKFVRDLQRPSVFELSYYEKDNFIELPVYVKKYFHIGRNTLPYITAGVGWLYLTRATGNATLIYTYDGSSISSGNINMLETRNRNTFEWIAGIGVGYRMKNLRLFLDARYYGGLNSFTDPEKSLTGSTLVNDFYYIDNEVKLSQFEIGASISYTLINSVKRARQHK